MQSTKIYPDNIPTQSSYFRVILRVILCIYIAVTIPLRLAFIPEFDLDLKSFGTFLFIDLWSNIFFIFDDVISYQNDAKAQNLPVDNEFSSIEEESDTTNYSKNRSWLVIALFSCLPLEYITLLPVAKNLVTNYFMINRIIRVISLPNYIGDISKLLEYKGVRRNIGILRAWMLFFIMALAGHLCCCGFFFVAKWTSKHERDFTWVEELELIESTGNGDLNMLASVAEAYIQALYWAYITMVSRRFSDSLAICKRSISYNTMLLLLQITTGFGDIVPLSIPETVWCILTMFLGVMITACAIANLQLVVTNVDAALTNFQQKTSTVSKFMRYRMLPNNLQNRVMSFYHYQWDLLKGADEERFMFELPKSLQQQVSNFMCRDLIASLPILRDANIALLNAITDAVEVHMYSPEDNILKVGETIRGTLVISRGEVEVLVNGRVERKMKRCDTFAEESLFMTKTSDKNIKAKTFCELFTIPSDSFQHIVESQCDVDQINQMRDIAVTISKNSRKAHKLFGSGEEAVPLGRFWRLFHPNSAFRAIWDFFALLGCLFYMFSIPLMLMRFLDGQEFHDNLLSFGFSYIIDSFFLVDLCLRFNCFMYFEEGLVVSDREKIRAKFFNEHCLVWELLVAVPIDVLIFVFMNDRLSYIYRVTKIFRLRQIIKLVADFNRHLSDFRIGGDMVFVKVITLNFVLFIVCHWVGTMWHGCADLSLFFGYLDNWRNSDEEDETLSISHSDLGGFSGYLRSVYWAIVGMSTTGYGDIVPTNLVETTFATIVILFGGLILPAVVGGLAAYLGNLNLTRRNYRKKLMVAKSYMNYYMIDRGSVNRVMSYYDYLWSRQNAIDEDSIMNEFPWPLRQQVCIHLHSSRINGVPFFSNCDDNVRELIVSILKPSIFMPMDVVIQKGEIGTSMYFIEKGEVAIVAESGMAYCVLETGDYFGESSLLSSSVLSSSARALTYCDVFVLQKEDFVRVMESFVSHQTKNEITKNMIKTMNKKMKLNSNVNRNLSNHEKCCTLVSMIDLVEKGGSLDIRSTQSETKTPICQDSRWYLVWSMVIILICLYNAWIVPFRLGFLREPFYQLDWCCDIVLIFDMYLNYCKFAFLFEGEVVDKVEQVKKHYVQMLFPLDLLSSLPYEMIYCIISTTKPSPIVMASIRSLRLLRVIRVPKLLSVIFNFLEDNNINLAPFRLVEFLTGVVLIAHWAACGFYAMALWKNNHLTCAGADNGNSIVNWANDLSECLWQNTWIQRQIMNGKIPYNGGSDLQRYIRAFNWALPTLVVVVIGDVVPVNSNETLYAFIWMILGVTINAAIIGNVANIVANIDTESSVFIKRADEIKKFMHEMHISNQLQDRVDYFLTSLWQHRESLYEDSFINSIPPTLQLLVTQRTRQRHIAKCPFFDFCSNEIIKALSLRLKLRLYNKDDIIVHAGDMGRKMFFLNTGTVDIVSNDGKTVFATLSAISERRGHTSHRESAFFGETSLFFKRRRTNTVRASSYCEVYVLRKYDLDRELRQRDFDLNRMLRVFTKIADSNRRRNKAVEENLKMARSHKFKLFKLVGSSMHSFDKRKRIRPFLLPNSTFRKSWDITCIFLTVYITISVPFQATFAYKDFSEYMYWIIIDSCIDAFFIVDCYCRYYIFPITTNGSIVIDRNQIKLHYMSNGIYWDILACSPIDWFMMWFDIGYFFQARLIRVMRIIRLPAYLAQIEVYLNMYNIRINAAKRLLFNMLFYYALVNHFCACIWFAIHRFLEPNVKYTWATTDCPTGDGPATHGCIAVWKEDENTHNICDDDLIGRCYVRSLYFVLTTTSTVGYGKFESIQCPNSLFVLIPH